MKTIVAKSGAVFFFVFILLSSCRMSGHTVPVSVVDSVLKRKIDSGYYRIEVDKTFGVNGGLLHLTSGYFLQVSGDTVSCYLPFYGRAYSAPSDLQGGGIEFNEVMTNVKRKTGSGGSYWITFDVRSTEDAYRVTLSFWPEGKAEINIAPNTRSLSRYLGQLRDISVP